MRKQWLAYLSATNHALLKHLYTAAGNSTLSPRIFTANQNSGQGGDWYGSWDGPNAPLPTYHGRNENNNQQPAQPVAQAKSQSKIALASVFLWDGMTTESLASQLTDTFKHDHWDGFVLQAGDGKDFVKMGSRKSMPPATSHSGR